MITVKGRELLERARVVLYDALAHPGLLEFCRKDAELVSVGKRAGAHSMPQQEITRLLIDYAKLGHEVVRLKGGDPYLFARGAEEAEALVDAGIEFAVVPGICSPVGTSTYAGFPLTHRDLSSSVTFVTGTDKRGQHWSYADWAKLAMASDTLCILMGMRRIEDITRALIAGGRDSETKAAVVEWGARPEQRVAVATLGTIAARVRELGLSNPSVIVVGDVVGLREKLRFFDKGALFGKRLLLPRPAAQARASAKEIRQRGAVAVVMPLIAIEDPEDLAAVERAVASLATYDWVLLTSANGAERLLDAITRAGRDARAFGSAKIGIIGPKTGEPLKRLGLVADLVAEEHVAEGLLLALAAQQTMKRVLLFRAADAREVLPETLRARGIEVDVVAAYQTLRVTGPGVLPLKEELVCGRLDAVLVTSSSMAQALGAALGPEAPELLRNTTVASIGPVTSASLEALGIAVNVVASRYTVQGLLDALEQGYAKGECS